MDEMSDKELVTMTIEHFTDLQRIKKANGDTVNEELDYQIRITTAKLSAMGISIEDISM